MVDILHLVVLAWNPILSKLFDFFLQFANFLREFAKVTEYLEFVEIKIFNTSFWTNTSYRNIKNTKIEAVFLISTLYS